MSRFAVVFSFFFLVSSAVAQNPSSSDPFAVSLAHQSVAALTGGVAISDITLNGNVISILGSDYETGTGTFEAKGTSESRIDLNLSGGTRSDVRNLANGAPAGAWQKSGGTSTPYAQHNCWTDSAWFFPALSSLTQTASPGFVFKYIGPEQHNGVSVQHIQIFQASSNDGGALQRLSTADFYLDTNSNLPVAVAFNAHADDNMNVNVPTETDFGNYQAVNGVQVPFHFQKIVNGGVSLDVTVTSAAFNTGLVDSLFSLQ